jgi:tetratricopeptide (TPR) repeat protein
MRPRAEGALRLCLGAGGGAPPPLRLQMAHSLGILLRMQGRPAEAVSLHEDIALTLADSAEDRARAIVDCGAALAEDGRHEAAVEALERALEIFPAGIETYLPLVRSLIALQAAGQGGPWRGLLHRMHVSLKQRDQSKHLHADIFWALSSAYEADGQYKLSWKYLEKAHRRLIDHRGLQSSGEDMQRQLDGLRAVFQASVFPHPPFGSPSALPVFLVGMFKSGSCLLESMLLSRIDVFSTGTYSYFQANLFDLQTRLGAAEQAGIKDIIVESADDTLRLMMSHYKAYEEEFSNPAIGISKKMDQSWKRVPQLIMDRHLQNYQSIGFIHLAFPLAPILNVVRDPLDTLLSIFRHNFDNAPIDWTLDATLLVRRYVTYLETMHHFRNVLPGRVLDVSYEQLVLHPEQCMKDIVSHLKIPWDPAVLSFGARHAAISLQRHGIDVDSCADFSATGPVEGHIGRWKHYAQEMAPLIKLLKPELQRLKQAGGLPFADSVNWNLEPDHLYAVDEHTHSHTDTASTDTSTDTSTDAKSDTKSVPRIAKRRRKRSTRRPLPQEFEVSFDGTTEESDDTPPVSEKKGRRGGEKGKRRRRNKITEENREE